MTVSDKTEYETKGPISESGLAQLFSGAHTHTTWLDKTIDEAVLKQLYDLVMAGKGIDAFNLLVQQMTKGAEAKIESDSMLRNAWTKIMDLADQYNDPGEFTAFIGYEWTSQPGGSNLHRVVVFRGDKASVDPVLPFSAFDSENVEDL